MTAEEIAEEIAAGAAHHLTRLIQAAEGDKQASRELHQHIRQDAENGLVLDGRLARYVVSNGLPPKGKGAEDKTFAVALAVALRINRGETRQDAIKAVAGLSFRSDKTVEAAFKGETRRAAEEWVNDPERRRALLALAAPYL